jgi:hypothetical protein
MATDRKRRDWSDWLVFRSQAVHRDTIRRHYKRWRHEHGLPRRCDNPKCQFHADELVWNGESLDPILDHINGNRFDNRPENLRYLCPNCDSQLPTRGGANKGHVTDLGSGKFTLVAKDGTRHSHIFPEPGKLSTEGYAPTIAASGQTDGGSHAQPAHADGPLLARFARRRGR